MSLVNQDSIEKYVQDLEKDLNFKILYPELNPREISPDLIQEMLLYNMPRPYLTKTWIEKIGPKRSCDRNIYQYAYMLYDLASYDILPNNLDSETALRLVNGEDPTIVLKKYNLNVLQKAQLTSSHCENFAGTIPRKRKGYKPRAGNIKTSGILSKRREVGSGYKQGYRGSGGETK